MSGAYGTILSRSDIEDAFIHHLGDVGWLEAYLEDYEVQHKLNFQDVPRLGATDIYGGVDAESFTQAELPAIAVICEPVEEPEATSDGDYLQWYEVTLSCVAMETGEHDARRLADAYGTAVMGAVGQHGSISGFALDTRLQLAPNARFMDPDTRRVGQADVVFRTLVAVMNRRLGPQTVPPIGEEPPESVPATSVDVTLSTLQ